MRIVIVRRTAPKMDSRNGASPRKRAANVSVGNDLLDQARRHGINLSQVLEERLSDLRRAWLCRWFRKPSTVQSRSA
jgi:post-segregation antitoxin (ccd killing protein)